MTLNRVIHFLTEEYRKANENPKIRKPISYALYQTWEYVQAIEKDRWVE